MVEIKKENSDNEEKPADLAGLSKFAPITVSDIGVDDAHVADRRWRMPDVGTVRLNPVERANPAYQADPAFGRTSEGAYGGRGPRVEAARAGVGAGVATRFGQAPERAHEEQESDLAAPVFRRGDYGYTVMEGGCACLVEYQGLGGDVTIPPRMGDIPVLSVGESLFRDRVDLFSVVISDGVRVIEPHAFDGCSSLTSALLPASLERVGAFAFAKTALDSALIPSMVKSIGEKAFFHSKNLSSVVFSDGLEEIGEYAFAHTALGLVDVPASVSNIGFNAFEATPAQRWVDVSLIKIDASNPYYRIDGAGLYRGDELVELVGDVSDYTIAPGTWSVAAGACKRHPSLATISLPEGVKKIGNDAFRGNRRLVRVDLPESLESIGSHAFADTSVSELRISRSVREIGEGALLTQGENQMTSKARLGSVLLDPSNPVFYIESGLLCERDASPDGGDVCVLYVGPDNIVRIPDAVTTLAPMAFAGADGVDELFVHDHMRAFCHGCLSTARSIPLVHVDFAYDVDGFAHGDFPLPSLSSRFRYLTSLFGSYDGKTFFDFDYYDSWVTCTTDIGEFARAAIVRMRQPMGMSERARSLYEGILMRKGLRVCSYFADLGHLDALELLVDKGLLGLPTIVKALEASTREGNPQATACLLEMKRRMEGGGAELDFSL